MTKRNQNARTDILRDIHALGGYASIRNLSIPTDEPNNRKHIRQLEHGLDKIKDPVEKRLSGGFVEPINIYATEGNKRTRHIFFRLTGKGRNELCVTPKRWRRYSEQNRDHQLALIQAEAPPIVKTKFGQL